MSDLPEGWRRVQLKDCGTWWSGGTPATEEPRFWGGDIPWISAASLKSFDIVDSDRRVTRAGSMAGTRVVDEGAVLFVVRGMSLKTEFRVGIAKRRVAFGQDCKAILPNRAIDGTFLALALKGRERSILGMVDEAGHGTGRLPTDLLEKLALHIPEDVREQRRIADYLDALDHQMAIARVEKGKREIIRSGLLEDCVRRATAEAHHWEALGQIAEVASGVTLGGEPGGGSSVSLPYLRVANVQDGFFDLSDMKSLRVLRSDVDRYSLRPGDLLLTEGGDWDKLGRGAVWDGRISPCLYQNHIFRIRCDRRVLIPEYLALYVSSSAGRSYFARIAKQTSNLATINSTELKAMAIPVPSLSVQRNLVESLTACDAEVQAYSESLSSMESLREGIAEDLLLGRVRV